MTDQDMDFIKNVLTCFAKKINQGNNDDIQESNDIIDLWFRIFPNANGLSQLDDSTVDTDIKYKSSTILSMIFDDFFKNPHPRLLTNLEILQLMINTADTKQLLETFKKGVIDWPANTPLSNDHIIFIKNVLICIENKLKNESEENKEWFNDILGLFFKKFDPKLILKQLDYENIDIYTDGDFGMRLRLLDVFHESVSKPRCRTDNCPKSSGRNHILPTP